MNEKEFVNNKGKGLLCLILAITVAVCVIPLGLLYSFADGADKNESGTDVTVPDYDSSDYQTSDEIKEAIDKLNASLNNIDSVKDDLYKQLEEALANKEEIESKYLAQKLEADAEIQLIEIKLDVQEKIVAQYDLLIYNKESEIGKIEDEYAKVYRLFAERLRQSYEEGVPGTLEIFLNSETFIEMLTSIERMKDILEYDTDVMGELDELRITYINEKAELEAYLSEQQGVITQLQAGRATLEEKVAESLTILDLQENNIDEFILLLEIAEQNRALMSEKIEKAIKDYYEQLEKEEQKEYQLTEEYKRIYVKPGILKKMESGAICKGSEYYEDGEEWVWPLPMKYYSVSYITSDFGWRTYTNSEGKKVTSNHKGYDIGVPANTEIYAVKSGVVITSAYNSSYGNYIVVLHEDGTTSWYAHCKKLLAEEGEYVLQGENIALVGSTGRSTGNHLHIEIQVDKTAVDPADYIEMPKKNKEN